MWCVIRPSRHPEIQRGKLRQLGAEQLFDGMLVGGEEVAAGAAEKPAASIFLKACQLAVCQPCEVYCWALPLPQSMSLPGTKSCRPSGITPQTPCSAPAHGAPWCSVCQRTQAAIYRAAACLLLLSEAAGAGHEHPGIALQALHIGDSLSADIQGGINAGLATTIWVSAKHAVPPRGAPMPAHIVRHVTELPGVLRKLGVQ